jgi:hypothetical protein
VRVETPPQPVEQMTTAIEPEGAGAVLRVEDDPGLGAHPEK